MIYPRQTIHLLRCILIAAVLVMYQNVVHFFDLSGCLLAEAAYHAMGDSIKAAEARLTEIAVLKTHIINYARPVMCTPPTARHGMRCRNWFGHRKTWSDFLRRKRTLPRKHRPDKRIPPRSFPSWEASSADFLVYIAVLRSNAPVTRIFSPRSFRVLRQAGACTKGSGIYTVRRQHKRLPGSFSPQCRQCTVRCVPGPCRFARHAPSD